MFQTKNAKQTTLMHVLVALRELLSDGINE